MRTAAALLLLFSLGCNSSSSPTEPSAPVEVRNESLTLPFGRTVEVNSDLQVALAEILEDSRCPASVVCVWQGNGKIRLAVTTRRGAQSIELNTVGSVGFPREASALGYTFTLEELRPARQTPDPVQPQQYAAVIRVNQTR